MSINIIVSIATLFLTAIISFLVLAEDRRNRINITFAALGFSIVLWILSNILADLSKDVSTAFFWSKLAIIWPAILPNVFFYLVVRLYYFDNRASYKKVSIFFLLISSLIIILSPTYLNIRSVTMQDWGIDYEPGPLYYVLFIYFIVAFGWAFYLLRDVYRFSKEPQKHLQAKYMLIGAMSTAILATVTNILLPIFGYSISSIFGPPGILFFIGFTAYAVTKHHLFNVRVIATELLTSAIWIFLLIQTLLSGSLIEQFSNGVLLALVVFFGVLLIRSVLKEVEQREKLEVLTKELGAANAELKKLDQLKSDFLSFATHQLRGPLAITKGYISMVHEGTFGEINKRADEVLMRVYDSNERLIRLVNDFLNISRIEQGRIDYTFSRASIVGLIDKVIEVLRPGAERRGLQLVWKRPSKEIHDINMDESKIYEVIYNLADNAIKYTKNGSVTVSAEERETGNVLVSVKDTGVGLTKEEIANLFQRFGRVDGGRQLNVSGVGIGLYVAKYMVEGHKGRIWAESEGKNKGSAFYVELPAAKI